MRLLLTAAHRVDYKAMRGLLLVGQLANSCLSLLLHHLVALTVQVLLRVVLEEDGVGRRLLRRWLNFISTCVFFIKMLDAPFHLRLALVIGLPGGAAGARHLRSDVNEIALAISLSLGQHLERVRFLDRRPIILLLHVAELVQFLQEVVLEVEFTEDVMVRGLRLHLYLLALDEALCLLVGISGELGRLVPTNWALRLGFAVGSARRRLRSEVAYSEAPLIFGRLVVRVLEEERLVGVEASADRHHWVLLHGEHVVEYVGCGVVSR